jgi:ABC-type transport system substrate-binding protein
MFAIGLAAMVGGALVPLPAQAAKLERLKIAVAPLGWDTNFTWLQSRSGMLDKRPALEYLIGIDRNTGTYIPQLAEKWDMASDGKSWTLTLRKGVKFHENWGEFTAKDVRHSIFLIAQPESVQTDAGLWRSLMGIEKADSIDDVAKKVEQMVQIVDDHTVTIHTKTAAPELFDSMSANNDLVMESKARWDAGGKDLYGQKVVGTGPFEFVERKVGSHVLYKRVENHWRQTPEYKELEFRWVPEGVTRLASLLAEEVHISDVERALQKDAEAKGIKIVPSKRTAIAHEWLFGGLYFATSDKLDAKQPFVDKRVRQALNMAINRKAIADAILGGKAESMRVTRFHPDLDGALWPGIWNPEWDTRFEAMYGYNPAQAKKLLADAGYKNGFEFTVYLYTLPGLPEIVDIGQALALDWEAVGLKPKLVEIDFPRVREQYRTKTIHGAVWPLRGSPNALNLLRIFNKAKDSVVYSYEHPYIEERHAALGTAVDKAQRAKILREIGDHKFNEFADMPLFWLHAEAGVNPKYIAEYTFPGSITGFFTHLEYIKLAP